MLIPIGDLEPGAASALNGGTSRIYVFCDISYVDVSNREYSSKFCMRLPSPGKTNQLSMEGPYNEMK